jgi:hypothetical protein
MAICMSVAAGHIHNVACDAEAMRKNGGRSTTQIGMRIPDKDAVKLRELASRYDSLNDYLTHLIRTQALRER